MRTKRSALLGLVLGLAVFGAACEDKTEVQIPPEPDPPIVVTVTPQQLTLEVGQSATLAAAVTGGAAGTAKTVTWSSSNSGIASVDASGNVTAVAAGVATVTATSTADAAAKAAAAITVTAPPPPATPSVSIKSITQFATTIPVALNNVFGQIDITLNLDIPTGAQVSALRTYINNTKVCEQTFASPELGATEEVNEAADVICSVNTAAYTGTPGVDNAATITFPNGPGYKVRAEIVDPTGTISAEIASADMTFNNPSFIVGALKSPTHCVTGALAFGATFWCEGDIVADFLPVTFSTNANDAVSSITLNAVEAPNASTAAATDASAPFSITLQKSGGSSASRIHDFEGNVALTVTSTTAGGQTGSNCINPDPVINPIGFCTPATWFPGTGGMPTTAFLVDNVVPDVSTMLFDMTPATLGCAPAGGCYINAAFSFAIRSGFFAATDNGVGGVSATFMSGTPGAEIPVTTGADLSADNGGPGETELGTDYRAKATVKDGLDNSVTVYPSTGGGAQTSSSGAQRHGYDETNPTATFAAGGVANNSTNVAVQNPAWAINFSDAATPPAGPSGFSANPVSVLLKRYLPASTVCFNPINPTPTSPASGGTSSSNGCKTTSGADNWRADDGQIDILWPAAAGAEGYWNVMAYVTDQAGNDSDPPNLERTTLNDVTAPVLGGISHPSSMAGNAAFAVTMDATDNVDMGWFAPWFNYGGTLVEGPVGVVGAYGFADGMVGQQTLAYNVTNFMRAVETTNAAGRVVAGPNIVGSVGFQVYDVAGNSATQSWGISPAVLAPVGGTMPSLTTINAAVFAPANALHGNFINQAPSNATVCSGTSSACGSSPPASTVLSATMTGPNATFANPFTSVRFYYQDPVSTRWVLIGTGAPAASDNTVTSTRTWTYSATWTATGITDASGALLAGPINVVAIGQHSSGSGVVSTGSVQVVTVTTT